MVVPMENISASSSKSKRYIGNGLVIHLQENHSTITVIGNECRIKIDVNDGTLKIVGNSCRAQVTTGNGKIIYIGNEGRVRLGPGVDEKKVTYVGNEGKIVKEVQPSSKNSKNTKENQKETDGCRKTKLEEVPLEKTRRSSNVTLNIVGKSHKRFSLSESMMSFTVPSVIAVPNATESVIKIRREKNDYNSC